MTDIPTKSNDYTFPNEDLPAKLHHWTFLDEVIIKNTIVDYGHWPLTMNFDLLPLTLYKNIPLFIYYLPTKFHHHWTFLDEVVGINKVVCAGYGKMPGPHFLTILSAPNSGPYVHRYPGLSEWELNIHQGL